MYFYFIRHGQSINNALFESTGETKGRIEDPELTQIGKQQAQTLAEFIKKKDEEALASGNSAAFKRDYFGFTHLYTSLMVRSVQTGIVISNAIQVPLVGWPEIHETGGIFLEEDAGKNRGLPGKTRSYFQTHYQDLVLPESVSEEGWWNRPFEAEEERQVRAKVVLQMLIDRHGGTNDRVAIVSHGGFYNHLMQEIFDLNWTKTWFSMFNTGVSCIEFKADNFAYLIYHNRSDHLTENLLT